jgi:hypothetical protein
MTAKRTLLCMTVCAIWLSASSARADSVRDELGRINDIVNDARKNFQKTLGKDPAREASRLDDAAKLLNKARAAFKPKLESNKKVYAFVEDNLSDAEDELKAERMVLECARRTSEIAAAQRDGKTVSDEQLDALDRAVARLKKGPVAGWGKSPPYYAKRAKQLRAENPRIAERARKAATRKAEQQAAQRRGDAARALSAIELAVKRNQEITGDLLTALAEAMEPLVATDEGAVSYFRAELTRYTALSMWSKADPDAAEAIAATLGGDLVTSGRTKGKKLKLSFKVASGRCYALFGQFASWSGSERVNKFAWNEAKSGKPLQTWKVWRRDGNAPRIRGFCTRADGKVGASAELEFAGSRNGLRYAVVSWERSAFPVALAGKLSIDLGDACDFDHWSGLWTDPVPGTFAYVDGEPVLVTAPGYKANGGYLPISVVRLGSGGSRDARAERMTIAVPKQLTFRSQFSFKGCPNDYDRGTAVAKLSRSIVACYDKIEKKYEGKWRKVTRLREAADRKGAISPYAERLAEKIDAQATRDQNKKCVPIENKAKKLAERTFNSLVDTLTDARHQAKIDRPEYLRQILK